MIAAAAVRDAFPGLARSNYLVSHSMGAAPAAARDALVAYWNDWSEDGPEAWERWLPRIGAIADGIGAIVGAPPGTIYLAPNVAVLQAAVASSLDYRGERNEVVIEAPQFPSLGYVWSAWQRFGARIVSVPSDDARTVPTDRLVAAITERTAIVILSHAYFLSGALVDVGAVAERARACGALVMLDVYQTAGVYPFDLGELGVEIAVGGSHKWLCGGPGCGYIYVHPRLRDRFAPAITGWMAHADPFSFEPPPVRYAEGMSRFGTGTPTIPGYIAAEAGHALIRKTGVAAIREHNVRLTSRIAEMALERGMEVVTPLDPARRTGWVGVNFPGADRAYKSLASRRIFVDYRPNCGLRVGPHFYSTDDEIRELFETLDELV